MNTELNDEQKILKDSVRNFIKGNLDSESLAHMIQTETSTGITKELWAKMSEQGWIGCLIPEEDGGLGLGVTEMALIMEEMGRAILPGPFFSTAVLGGPLLARGGTGAAKAKWMEKILTGEAVATLALIEEDAQFGPQYIQATAKKDGDGYVLNGKKFFVPDLAAADVIIVGARTSDGEKGVTLFLVEKSAAGVTVEENRLTDMTSHSGQLGLKDVKVGADAVIGKADGACDLVKITLQKANVCIAAGCVAAAERVLTQIITYAKERQQFGKPIGSFQAVKHPLADLYAEIESARSAYHYACWAVDSGAENAEAAVAVARLTGTATFRDATLKSLQAHGGIGFTWEYDLHWYLKRAKHWQYLLGMPHDYEEIIAREAIGI